MFRVALALALFGVSLAASAQVEVLQVERMAATGAAPLAVGDRILGIRTVEGTQLRPERVIDWLTFEFDELPHGAATLEVARGDQRLTLSLEDGRQRVLVASAADDLDAAGRAEDAALVALLKALYGEQLDQLAARLDALPAADTTAPAPQQLARALVEADALVRQTRLPEAIARLQPLLGAAAETPMQALAHARLGWALSYRGGAQAESQTELSLADAAYARLAPTSASAVDVVRMRWQAEALAAPQAAGAQWSRIQSALAEDARCSDCLVRVRALVGQATVATLADQPEDAIRLSQQALALVAQIPDMPAQDRFGALNTQGYAELVLDRLDEALATHAQMLAVARSPRGNPRNLVTALQRTGLLQQAYGQTAAARSSLSEALTLAQRLQPGTLAEYNPRVQLAHVHLDLGDYAAARAEYLQARALLDAMGQHVMGYAFLQFDLGRLETEVGDLAAAEREIRRGLEVAIATNPKGVATSQGWTQLAVVLTRAARFDDASAALDAADQINAQQPPDCGCRWVAQSERAWLELARGHPERAAELLAAVAAGPQSPSLAQQADLLYARAEAARRLGQYARAREWLQSVIDTRSQYAPYQPQLAQAWFALGETEQALAHPDAARSAWCKAADVLDLSSARVGGDSLALAQFRSQFVQIYQRCLDAEYEQGDSEAAWRVLERSRARAFLYALEQRQPEGVAAQALDQWLGLRKRLATLIGSLAEPALQSGRSTALRTQVAELVDQLHPQAAADQDPVWTQLLDPSALSLREVQRTLPDGALLLMYSLREDHSLLFALDRQHLRSARLAIGRAALAERVQQLRATLARRDLRELPALQQQAEALYADLLGPAADWWDDQTRLLLVAPEGPLHELPFALLRDPQRQQYLIEQVALSVVESGSVLGALQQRAQGPAVGALVVGVGTGGAVTAPAWRGTAELPALPDADAEARTVARLHPGASTLLRGARATEPRVLHTLAQTALAHFAVHALVSTERPLESALVLAPDASQPGSAGDGALQLWELLGSPLQVHARVVVLSACATARGAETLGEGLQGFARSFQLIGADAVVASLWPVGDRPTRRLMEAFHRELLKSAQTPAQALRSAMLAMQASDSEEARALVRGVGGLQPRSGGVHPYDWAAFQVYGLNR